MCEWRLFLFSAPRFQAKDVQAQTFRPQDIQAPRHFGPRMFRPLDVQAPRHLGPWKFRPQDIQAPGHLGPWPVLAPICFGPKEISALKYFNPQTFLPLDVLPSVFWPTKDLFSISSCHFALYRLCYYLKLITDLQYYCFYVQDLFCNLLKMI